MGDIHDDFIQVKHKKGRRFKTPRLCQNRQNIENHEDNDEDLSWKVDNLKTRINLSSEEMKLSEFFLKSRDLLCKSIKDWPSQTSRELVVYGLGNFSSSIIAKQQLDLALALRQELKIAEENSYCYDPVFSCAEIQVLKDLGWTVPVENEEGKRRSSHQCIYYLPHCGKSLYNNILWYNWSVSSLSNIIIIGNSFTSMVDRSPKRVLEKCGNYILKIQPSTTELPLPNKHYKQQDVFNDMSIHLFNIEQLRSLSDLFWTNPIEPVYSDEDSDFISAKQK